MHRAEKEKLWQERLCDKEREAYINEILNNLENLLNDKEKWRWILKKEEIIEALKVIKSRNILSNFEKKKIAI